MMESNRYIKLYDHAFGLPDPLGMTRLEVQEVMGINKADYEADFYFIHRLLKKVEDERKG